MYFIIFFFIFLGGGGGGGFFRPDSVHIYSKKEQMFSVVGFAVGIIT